MFIGGRLTHRAGPGDRKRSIRRGFIRARPRKSASSAFPIPIGKRAFPQFPDFQSILPDGGLGGFGRLFPD
jgi:hypothetical protein